MRGPPSTSTAPLGDVIADVDVRPAAATHDVAADGRCRNCGAATAGNYCAHCGQSTTLHPPTVVEFLHEFIGHYVAAEGPLLRTLHALLVRPGSLTADYFAGRRQRYIAPLRLYLTMSLILFAVAGATGGLRFGGSGHDAIEFSVDDDEASKAGVVIAPRPLHEGSAAATWMKGLGRHIAELSPTERRARMRSAVQGQLPYVLIVLVPLLAAIFKGVYWNRHRLYGEHLVVAFHAQTVAFLFALLSSLPFGEWWGDLVVVALFVHGAVALRRVYGGRWWTTVGREALVLVLYAVLVALAAAGVTMSSLAR